MFTVPGDRTFGSVRPALPNVNGAGCENTDALRYPLSLAATDPVKAALCPLLFGRNTFPPALDVFCVVGESGNPVCSVAMPFNCQPPSTASTARFQCAPNCWPRPKGKLYTPLVIACFEISFEEIERSPRPL